MGSYHLTTQTKFSKNWKKGLDKTRRRRYYNFRLAIANHSVAAKVSVH